MKSLLNALQEGRLIELPDPDKDKALEYLAVLIEAIPDIGTGFDLVEAVKARERSANTGIGMGVACPHVVAPHEGELLCAVGWSPQGIDYQALDGKKVHIVIMYYIPNTQRNSYLKEISGLAQAVHTTEGIASIAATTDLASVRNHLLDWVSIAIDAALPDVKARMIKLEARHATVSATLSAAEPDKSGLISRIISFTVLVINGEKYIVLSQNRELVEDFEKQHDIIARLKEGNDFLMSGYYIAIRASSRFQPDRTLYECLALKSG